METDNPTMDFMQKYCRKAMKWTGYLDWIEKNVNYGFILKDFKEVNNTVHNTNEYSRYAFCFTSKVQG